ncbi:ABC transporter ATP-binding protein [Campylobacter canadensis]|uniref:ABC transporter ATP-binding protein n=1 Tax=Campylobacter canadensis TaxID=449520 RepID=A0ABS7WQ55_9BACT|nr:ABC transporter ATP-binding protein [Campylobacter canadensis]MBZ7986891.1 ABC transporter ATP-binding protein [Campylobacter canadensis]MBZ7994212.1 ABC transporter ATP-binding protein [Campylobacter canadensis]MBZ7995795.1 ABC transporter ATP-binding protein [Campylobacter canadensis]MBZ7997928.1 ABC transporter ATP-binding protein [Campylobacter canadensis]MBZ7999544.1 ABC transporter ATP-binding protein [Campylobacter canadensis]
MKVSNLSFSYKNNEILKNINFEIQNGEILMVLGVNGIGKSTLMKCLAGVLKHDGKVELDGIKRTKIGYMTQNIIPNDCLSVFEFILLGRIGELKFKVSKEDLKRVEHVISHLGIEKYAARNFNELSGGQQRLVIVAQMLAKEPKLMFLDEPTANLDIARESEIMQLVKEYCKYYNVAAIINMHNLNHALRYADKILLLKQDYSHFCDVKDLKIQMLEHCFDVEFDIFTNEKGQRIIFEKF